MVDLVKPVSPVNTVSLFGKLPQKRDFVRIRHDSPEALALDRWLSGALADLAEHALVFEESLRFVFAQPDRKLVGILRPSRDRAGRRHPVALFAALADREIPGGAAAVPVALSSFFAEAERLTDDIPALSYDAVCSRVDALGEHVLASSGAARTASVDPLGPSASDEGAVGARAEVVRWATSDDAKSVLRCPANDAEHVASWNRLVDRPRAAAGGVSWFWSPQRRLVWLFAGDLPYWFLRVLVSGRPTQRATVIG